VQLLAADLVGDHEVRFLEDLQVLHDTDAGQLRQFGFEADEGPPVLLEETIKQKSSRRVGECFEHPVLIHELKIRD
jgi:hypothetical protein